MPSRVLTLVALGGGFLLVDAQAAPPAPAEATEGETKDVKRPARRRRGRLAKRAGKTIKRANRGKPTGAEKREADPKQETKARGRTFKPADKAGKTGASPR